MTKILTTVQALPEEHVYQVQVELVQHASVSKIILMTGVKPELVSTVKPVLRDHPRDSLKTLLV